MVDTFPDSRGEHDEPQTAPLDLLVMQVQDFYDGGIGIKDRQKAIDYFVRNATCLDVPLYLDVLQDPRYIAYCKKQDRTDEDREMGFVPVNELEGLAPTMEPRLKPGDKGWRSFWTVCNNP